MRLLFSRSASPHHGFAAYYTFLEKIFKADAVLHFGTHGSLEFMPGKQVGTGICAGKFLSPGRQASFHGMDGRGRSVKSVHCVDLLIHLMECMSLTAV